MSDQIKHECGVVMIRLLKPLSYYQEKYGTWRYGLNKLYLLMEKQHNRGQDGAGMIGLKLDMPVGNRYIKRKRSIDPSPIMQCFNQVYEEIEDAFKQNPDKINDADWAKLNVNFASECYLGHLRYGTFGRNKVELVHPLLRISNWETKTLALAGNFNLTNVDELFQYLVDFGQHPKEYSDTVTALELIGLYFDEENQRLFREYKDQGYNNLEITSLIQKNIDIAKILKEATANWDGGYVMCGIAGHGDGFVMRDPWGIRPAYYYQDDEIFVFASERPAIQTALNVHSTEIKELQAGETIIIKKSGEISKHIIREQEKLYPCSFERIYFSRGTDEDIYKERKLLGFSLVPKILDSVNHDIENSVFSFIPNTAETAFYGMVEGLEAYLDSYRYKKLKENNGQISDADLSKLLSLKPRIEKIAVKDTKIRTFITQDEDRNVLVEHIYDITYGAIKRDTDTLVIIDDSIVRGTTLRQSILKILDRLGPKKIVIVSSAPQIRYPDCYGIDMAKINDFIAFNAAISLLKERNMQTYIDEIYAKCKAQENLPKEEIVNYVKLIYKPFTPEEISQKISEIIKSDTVNAEVQVIFQSIEGLHSACPHNHGDWYFTGNYPTSGGNRVVNRSFINYYENKDERAY